MCLDRDKPAGEGRIKTGGGGGTDDKSITLNYMYASFRTEMHKHSTIAIILIIIMVNL